MPKFEPLDQHTAVYSSDVVYCYDSALREVSKAITRKYIDIKVIRLSH